MHAPYTSRILYHLVGRNNPTCDTANLNILRAILSSMEIRTNAVGGHSGGATIAIDPSGAAVNGEPSAQTVTCFCDIPFESLGIHTKKYGVFGVGVDREFVAKCGGRPVIYVPITNDPLGGMNEYLRLEALNAWNGIREYFPLPDGERRRVVGAPPTSAFESAQLAKDFITKYVVAFVKEFDVSLPDDHLLNYYMEREWRKLAKLPLHSPLREIVAPSSYHAHLRQEFSHLAHLNFRDVSSPTSTPQGT